jgi:hypothetical protein
MIINVRFMIGAHAYACVKDNIGQIDFLLSPGRSAQKSLRAHAADERKRAARIIRNAERAEMAADWLDNNTSAKAA